MTDSHENLKKITRFDINVNGANIPGFHLEGPYISFAKKGAQNENYIKEPNLKEFSEYKNVKKITVAPEVKGAVEFIKNVDCVVTLGHTNCTYDEAICAIEAGANCLTHTFNAMSPLNHRNPGVVGAALTNENVYCELICDTVHVNPALFGMMAKLKGEKLVLITDNIGPAGLPDGEYESGSLPVTLKSPYCNLHDGTIAGSVYHLNEAIRNFREHTTLPLPEVVKAASLNPATLMGEEKLRGSIKPGKRADIFIADRDFKVKSTFILGKMCYNSVC
jgi:N-acetylglucosamine-6-phosphate deacetylase